MLTRQGALIEEDTGIPSLTNLDLDPALASLHSAACTYRIALGPRAGQKVLTLRDHSLGIPSHEAQRCVSAQGFDVRCATHQRRTLKHLCRYITRPAIANKRLTRTRGGEVVLQLTTPYLDGTTHLVMTPLEFLQRLAALVPRPRLHLIRFHGVLAPNATLWAQIVPGEPEHATDTADEHGNTPYASTQARLSWAQLLKRVFEIDMASCPQCGGPLTIIAAIEDPAVMAKILTHLGLPTRAPPRIPAQLCTLFQTA
jgi:hypothetical protein